MRPWITLILLALTAACSPSATQPTSIHPLPTRPPVGALIKGILSDVDQKLEHRLGGDFTPQPDDLASLEKMLTTGVNPPQPRLQPELAAKIQADPGAEYEVIVQLFAEPPGEVMQQIESWLKVSSSSFGPVNIIEGKVKGSDVKHLLRLPLVKWIEERIPPDLGGGKTLKKPPIG